MPIWPHLDQNCRGSDWFITVQLILAIQTWNMKSPISHNETKYNEIFCGWPISTSVWLTKLNCVRSCSLKLQSPTFSKIHYIYTQSIIQWDVQRCQVDTNEYFLLLKKHYFPHESSINPHYLKILSSSSDFIFKWPKMPVSSTVQVKIHNKESRPGLVIQQGAEWQLVANLTAIDNL